MKNLIIIGIIALTTLAAVTVLVRRSGRKGCCGSGSDYKPRKKKLKKVISTKVFAVEGMHCQRCAGRVTEAVNDSEGVSGAVDLKNGIVTVSYGQTVPDEQIKERLQRLGYTVTKK